MIHWDPNPDLIIIPVLNWPIKWYGFFFALGFALGFPIFKNLLSRCFRLQGEAEADLKKKALQITDRLIIYIVVATIAGAKLGHILFYESPKEFLKNPFGMLLSREGLASHGAAIAILIALWLFARWTKKLAPDLGWLRLLDYISIPTALAGGFIRLGNFMNQEILGTPTSMPWGIVFGHPVDGSLPIARHPVQIYEALFYFAVFFLLWRLSFKPKILLAKGWLIGLFLLLVFSFRFFIEFFKEEQSQLVSMGGGLTMGQWLSIPFVLLGAALLCLSCMRCRKFRSGRSGGV